jgi:hypothetical protein
LLAQFANFLSQSERRLTDREVQTALGEEFLNVAIAEREPDIQPHGAPDDRREIGDERTRWLSSAIIIEPQPSEPSFA